jgi:sulfate-transporting ATPase
MTVLSQFALVGLGAGAAYALLALGLVLIRRGSGVVNFAHGAMGMLGAFLFYEFSVERGMAVPFAALLSIATVTALGALVYQLVMRPLMNGSALARIIVTLGLLMVIQGVCMLIWGEIPRTVPTFLPDRLLEFRGVSVGLDRLVLVAIAVVATAIVWAWVRFSVIGIALRANAENRVAASTLGWSPNVLGLMTWSVGGGLAALAGILIAPLTGIDVGQMSLLVIPALAATLVSNFKSFPITTAAAIGIGVLQSVASRYVDIRGSVEALPFVIILVALVALRPKAESRTHVAELLPRLGTGRLSPRVLPATVVLATVLMLVIPTELVYATITSLSWGIVMLSVVLILGYAGQLSLAQFALAGIAALIAGRAVSDFQMPFLLAFATGVLLVVPVGVMFALPALRTKGASLAVVTLGLAVTASALIFNNARFTGGPDGTPVGYPEIVGLPVDASLYPRRYAILVLAFFILCAIVVANVRRGASGRRLIAVRTNERAASALGVSVFGAKLYAFALAAAIAGIGGILLAFRNPFVVYNDFVPLHSILVVAYVLVGGVGYIFGAFNGGTLVAAGIGTWLLHAFVPGADPVWLSVIGGVLVILFVVVNPNGMTDDQLRLVSKVARIFGRTPATEGRTRVAGDERALQPIEVMPKRLEVEGLTVKFGGLTALNNVSVVVEPGQVVGLIGPNGAGKTTFIDAVTGFVRPSSGNLRYASADIGRWRTHARARAGISRSFQSLELFESNTVRDNLHVGADTGTLGVYVRDLVWPRALPLSDAALAAVDLLGLRKDLDTDVSDLSYGRRRLVAIARAVAAAPSVLLLDEPAAGLSSDETASLATVVSRLAKEWGIAILVIEHDMSFVMSVCDSVTVLDFGSRIGTGTPEEIRRDPAVVAAYLGAGSSSSPTEERLVPTAVRPAAPTREGQA